MTGLPIALGVGLAVYAGLVLLVGVRAGGRAGKSPEEYFLAGRGLGPVLLFMALFGTNATAFVLVGIPGLAYHAGVGVFGLNAPIIALGIPLTFWAVGAPARTMGRRLGALTPAELFRKRFASPALGILLVVVFTAYTVPYMVTAVKGAAVTLAGSTDGAVPEALGGAATLGLALAYTTAGGMRATAVTNVLQGALFLAFVLAAFFLVPASFGGFAAATEAVRAQDPGLLASGTGGLFAPRAWGSWALAIALTVIAFPHMLVRLMAGASDAALRQVSRAYPIALVLLWVPVVFLGVWGAAAFPGLEGKASDQVFALVATERLPTALGALGFIAVLAAVMSTLDAQILTLGSMLTRDVLGVLPERLRPPPGRDVRIGRIFGVVVAVLVWVLERAWGDSVFEIARLAFSGYVTLFPTLLLGVRWPRFTAAAAAASILGGNVALLAARAGAFPTLGFLPVFWGLLVAGALAVVVTYGTRESSPERRQIAFGTR